MTTDELSIRCAEHRRVQRLSLSGKLRLRHVPWVMGELTRALRRDAHAVVVCDVRGLQVPENPSLLSVFPATLRRNGGWPHRSLHLAGANPALAAALTSQRMHRFLPVHPTLERALDRAEQDVVEADRAITLDPDPSGLRSVRDAVEDVWPRTAPEGRDDAVLVVNELASNAIQHVALPFTVAVAVAPSRVLVAVTDRARKEPVVRPPEDLSTDGRGMRLVSDLAQDWGVRLVHPGGKTVWASIPARRPRVPRSRAPIPA
jgi:histidine kinase-like protein